MGKEIKPKENELAEKNERRQQHPHIGDAVIKIIGKPVLAVCAFIHFRAFKKQALLTGLVLYLFLSSIYIKLTLRYRMFYIFSIYQENFVVNIKILAE